MAIVPDTLHCANPHCLGINSGLEHHCQICGAPLIRRYLGITGSGYLPSQHFPGTWLGNRYLVVAEGVALDTQPGKPPLAPAELTEAMAAYLRLFPYRLAIPQLYGLALDPHGQVLLLEEAPIYPWQSQGHAPSTSPIETIDLQGTLMPELDREWQTATPQRQLNWLWQMARLWEPLDQVGVAWSLLQPRLLRVDGSVIRLLELDWRLEAPRLGHLGQVWAEWVPLAHPSIEPFLQQLTQKLQQGEIPTPPQLVQYLDQALYQVGQSQTYQIQIAAKTDTGPGRDNNEDACFPLSGQGVSQVGKGLGSLAIVCDGLGGHEGEKWRRPWRWILSVPN
jgi:protein phosphatase